MRITIDNIPDEIAHEIATGLITLLTQRTSVEVINHEAAVLSITPEWTPDRAAALLRDLPDSAAGIIRAAARNNGWSDASALRGPDGDASLRGQASAITKAINRGARRGTWPQGMPLPVAAQYDPNNPSYQRTTGYSMPEEIVPAFRTALDQIGPRS